MSGRKKNVKLTVRACMTCREPFKSEGIFERICRPCKRLHDNGAQRPIPLPPSEWCGA